MICALLVLQTPDLPAPLSHLSPWLDMLTRPRREVFTDLAEQEHRRFVKTHTPLDGLPHDPSVTYVVVGRDPRDVAISMRNHMDNMDMPQVLAAREASAEADGIELPPLKPPKARPDDPVEQFWLWVDDDTDPTVGGSTLRFTLHHLESFLRAPAELDVLRLHYDDLLADLPGQMRAIAEHLDIDVPDARWAALVEAASLARMREKASVTVPGSAPGQWRDPSQFFRRGTSRQWEELLDGPDDLARYAARARSIGSEALVDWVHRPALP